MSIKIHDMTTVSLTPKITSFTRFDNPRAMSNKQAKARRVAEFVVDVCEWLVIWRIVGVPK